MKTSARKIFCARRVAAMVVLGFVAGMAGCSTLPPVRTAHDSTMDFSRYRSFAVLTFFVGPNVPPEAALRLAQPAGQAVRDALTAKGMVEAPHGQADFAVNVRGESLPGVEITRWGYSSYPVGVRRRGWVYHSGYSSVDVRSTAERKLFVEIYDQLSHRQVWVGVMERSGTGAIEPQLIRDGVLKILADFPPKTKQP